MLFSPSAVFTEVIATEKVKATYRVYAHHFYNRVLVTDVILERIEESNDEIVVSRTDLMGNNTEDIAFAAPTDYNWLV